MVQSLSVSSSAVLVLDRYGIMYKQWHVQHARERARILDAPRVGREAKRDANVDDGGGDDDDVAGPPDACLKEPSPS